MITALPYPALLVNPLVMNRRVLPMREMGGRIGAMTTIRNIAIHHAGGLGNDAYASTKHLTVSHINNAHRARWDFPSRYMKDGAGRPWYFGYNAIYDPKDRSFTQGRALGEETAAQYGYNFDTFSVCIIGNHNRRLLSNPSVPVDPLTAQIEEDIVKYLYDLINGNKRGLFVAPGTTLDLSVNRVRPHRFYQSTDCYGTGIPDNHFLDLLIKYKPVVVTAPDGKTKEEVLKERDAVLQVIMQMIARLTELTEQLKRFGSGKRLSAHERSCTGTLHALELTEK